MTARRRSPMAHLPGYVDPDLEHGRLYSYVNVAAAIFCVIAIVLLLSLDGVTP